ncbi:MAG: hypothetical protein RR141_06435 [Rikenellaceae bacterium]
MGNIKTKSLEEALQEVAISDLMARHPRIFEGRDSHYTILKHVYIYNEYQKIRQEVKRKFPEVAGFLPQRYYYLIVSQRFSLTPNYVCAIITRIQRKGEKAFEEAKIAKQIIIEDECKKALKRKCPKAFYD